MSKISQKVSQISNAYLRERAKRRRAKYESDEMDKILTEGLNDREMFDYIVMLNRQLGHQIPDVWPPDAKQFCASQVEAFQSGLATIWNAQFEPPAGAGIPVERVMGELRKTTNDLAGAGCNCAASLVLDFVQKSKDSTGPVDWPG